LTFYGIIKMNKVTAIAEKKDSKLHVIQREKFEQAISVLAPGKYWITLEKIYKQRSSQQNRARFGIPYKLLRECFIDSTGEDVSIDFVHEFCKKRFLPSEYVEKLKLEWKEKKHVLKGLNKKKVHFPFKLTTTKLSTIEEMEYYKNIQRFGAEFFGVDIPDPDTNYVKELKNENTTIINRIGTNSEY
jgi:hypothetical protein